MQDLTPFSKNSQFPPQDFPSVYLSLIHIFKEDGSVTKVEMKDEYSKVEISKTDLTTGKELEGAKLQICLLYTSGGKTGLYDVGVPIKENTKLGYKLAREGDSIDLGYADVYKRQGVQFIVVYSVYQVIIMRLKITVYTDNVEKCV